MNLPKFLNEVDCISGKMAKEELASFIHDVARTLPEGKRDAFLSKLSGAHGLECNSRKADRGKENSISLKLEEVKGKLNSIEEGELHPIMNN